MSSFPINEKKLAPLSYQCTVIIHDAYCAFTFRKRCQSGKVALEEEGINQRIEEKGCLLMENNLNDSVSILLNYQTEYS